MWTALICALLRQVDGLPGANDSIWAGVPSPAGEVVRALLFLETDDERARAEAVSAVDDPLAGELVAEAVIRILARRKPRRALELATNRNFSPTEYAVAELARRDRDRTWDEAAARDPPDLNAMTTILFAIAPTDWWWAFRRLQNMQAREDAGVEALVRTLPAMRAEREAASDH